MNDAALSRWTALAGIATVALTLVAIGIFGAISPPTESDSPKDVAQFFADNRPALLVAAYVAALSLGFNLAFYVGLRDVLRRRAPETETLATIGAAGGIVFIAGLFVGFAVLMQLAYREGAGDPGLQRSLLDVYSLIVAMTGVPTAVSAIAISVAILQTGIFARWLGWYGFAVAAIHLVSVGSLAREGFFTPSVVAGIVAPLMFEVWVLAFSVLLLREPAKTA
jgi:hypothetical protein